MIAESQGIGLLELWGREFRVALERLDPAHISNEDAYEPTISSSRVLQSLIEYRGYVPGGSHGGRAIPPQAQLVEDVVRGLSKVKPESALCLRAHYCARGRWHDKLAMMRKALGSDLPAGRYRGYICAGEGYVLGALNATEAKPGKAVSAWR